jgi:hypothetical protein
MELETREEMAFGGLGGDHKSGAEKKKGRRSKSGELVSSPTSEIIGEMDHYELVHRRD